MYKNTRIRKNHRVRKTKKIQKGGNLTIKVMSYNVLARGATPYQNHGYTFENKREIQKTDSQIEMPKPYEHIEQTMKRYELIKKEIQYKDPDIVLLQEVDNYFFTYILKELSYYDGYFKTIVPAPKGDLSLLFSTAVLWKKKMFIYKTSKPLDNEIAKHNVVHNQTANVYPETISFHNKNATFVTLDTLDERNPNKSIIVVSFHLPGDKNNKNLFTQEKQNLLNYINAHLPKNEYIIIGGDLNLPIDSILKLSKDVNLTEQKEPVITDTTTVTTVKPVTTVKYISELTKLKHAIILNPNPNEKKVTTCDFDYALEPHTKENIDAIFCSENMTCTKYEVQELKCVPGKSPVYLDDESPKNSFASIQNGSDHAWIMATLMSDSETIWRKNIK
jgi:mRNA deadenylase 3'-5' endonuclease subunit Ccr4